MVPVPARFLLLFILGLTFGMVLSTLKVAFPPRNRKLNLSGDSLLYFPRGNVFILILNQSGQDQPSQTDFGRETREGHSGTAYCTPDISNLTPSNSSRRYTCSLDSTDKESEAKVERELSSTVVGMKVWGLCFRSPCFSLSNFRR